MRGMILLNHMSKVKVYFLNDVPGVAKLGDIKEVTAGHYRNFLVPRKLAVIATEQVIAKAAQQVLKKEKEISIAKKELEKLVARLSGVSLEFHEKANPQGHLFGSVTVPMIVGVLQKQGIAVEEHWIQLEHPIKNLGKHSIKVRLPNGGVTIISVEVTS